MARKYRLTRLSKPGAKGHPWCASCRGCSLFRHYHVKQTVGTEIHGTTGGIRVMFIAEGPGETEDEEGRPFVGKTGQMLRRVVRQINDGTEEGIAYGNVVRCRPTRLGDANRLENRPPSQQEISRCRDHVLRDIDRIKPDFIVLLGRPAAHGLAVDLRSNRSVNPSLPLKMLRGKDYLIRTPDGQYPATVTYHPSGVARNPRLGGLFKGDIAKAFLRAEGPDYSGRGRSAVMLDTVGKVRRFLDRMTNELTPDHVVMLDYETHSPSTKISRLNAEILTVAFSYGNERGYVIPYRHPESPFTGREFRRIRKLLRRFFTNPDVSFGSLAAHNIKYEAAVSHAEFGVMLGSHFPIECTMLRAHGLNENRIKQTQWPFRLKTLSQDWLGFRCYDDDDIRPVVEKVNQGRAKEVPLRALAEYNAMDCYVGNRLHEFETRLAAMEGYDETLLRLGRVMQGPQSVFAAWMEKNGIRADKEVLRHLMSDSSPVLTRLAEIEKELYALPSTKKANRLLASSGKKAKGMGGMWADKKKPWVFHINKPAAKRALFIDVLGEKLDIKKKWNKRTQTGLVSINKDFYAEFEGVREVDLIAEWAKLEKLRSTYIDPVYEMLQRDPDMRDGRVRGNLHFHTTVSNRSSISDPNTQNIPKGKTKIARQIKSMYMVDEGHVLVCADYSQAEIRGLAHISRDVNLIRAYRNAEKAKRAYLKDPSSRNLVRLKLEGDFHRQTAAQIFGCSPAEVTAEQRDAAKAIVFGLVYGMTEYGLMRRLSIGKQKALDYREAFLNQFPDAREWLLGIEKEGFEAGHVESPIGRRRHILGSFLFGDGDPTGKDDRSFKAYEDRICRNSPIQSLASDMNFMACIKIQRYIHEQKKSWRIVNVVHDSIIAEIPFHEVEEYIEVADRIMTDRNILSDFDVRFRVPLVADFTIGPNWGDQLEVDVIEQWDVVCRNRKKKCGEVRKVTGRVENRRCEKCGSKRVARRLAKGPLPRLLKALDKRHGHSRFWSQFPRH